MILPISVKKQIQRSLKKRIPFLREEYFLEKMVGPIGYWKELRRFQIEFLKSRGLLPHHSLLDIGCGPIQGGLAFIEYLHPGKYVGIDIRPEPIAAAYKQISRAGLAAKNPILLVTDTFGANELTDRTFDYIWASQILYHLNCDQLAQCLEQASSRLNPGGKLYGNIIFIPDTENRWNTWEGFPYYPHPLERLCEFGYQFSLSIRLLGRMKDFGYPDIDDLKEYFMLEFTRSESRGEAELLTFFGLS